MLDKTKNYKIDVSALNTAERTALQEELFKMGYYWIGFGKEPKHLNEDFLLLYEDMDIAYSGKSFFLKSKHTPITVSDIMPQTEERTLRDWFAGLAMVQIMQTHDENDVAGWAYHFADMMLKERNK